MRVAIFDRVEPPMLNSLPLRLVETCSHRAALLMLIAAIPVVTVIGVASLTLLVQAALAPAVRSIVAEHPAIALEAILGIVLWVYLLALPLKRLTDRLTVSRTVEIDQDTVRVIEQGHFRTTSWAEPLSSFAGVAHHVRASLSGTRHELILVHPEREKSVLLELGDKVLQTEVDRVATLLGHKEIPPGSLYRFDAFWPRIPLPAWKDPAHA